jgi:hypothetical protein
MAQLQASFAPPSATPTPGTKSSSAAATFLPGDGPIPSASTFVATSPAGTSGTSATAVPGAAVAPPASRRFIWLIAFLALAGALIWAAALSQPDGRLHVTFLDVGQGDATFVQTPSGRLVVIDPGPAPSSINDAVSRSPSASCRS